MKKLFIACLLVLSLGLVGLASADTITLNNPEQLWPPEATHMIVRNIDIDLLSRTMTIEYSYRDTNGAIQKDGRLIQIWTVRNIPDDPETDAALPHLYLGGITM